MHDVHEGWWRSFALLSHGKTWLTWWHHGPNRTGWTIPSVDSTQWTGNVQYYSESLSGKHGRESKEPTTLYNNMGTPSTWSIIYEVARLFLVTLLWLKMRPHKSQVIRSSGYKYLVWHLAHTTKAWSHYCHTTTCPSFTPESYNCPTTRICLYTHTRYMKQSRLEIKRLPRVAGY